MLLGAARSGHESFGLLSTRLCVEWRLFFALLRSRLRIFRVSACLLGHSVRGQQSIAVLACNGSTPEISSSRVSFHPKKLMMLLCHAFPSDRFVC